MPSRPLADETEVRPPVIHQLAQLGRAALPQLHPDAGISVMEPGNDLRQPRVEGGVIGAGHHPAHIQTLDPVGQLLVLLVQLRHSPHQRQQLLTGPCGGYPAPPPVQQGKARLPLQTVHQPADAGGGVAQRLGGSGQTSLMEYSEQNPAFFGVHEISPLL